MFWGTKEPKANRPKNHRNLSAVKKTRKQIFAFSFLPFSFHFIFNQSRKKYNEEMCQGRKCFQTATSECVFFSFLDICTFIAFLWSEKLAIYPPVSLHSLLKWSEIERIVASNDQDKFSI
jgi:hypothetical protein